MLQIDWGHQKLISFEARPSGSLPVDHELGDLLAGSPDEFLREIGQDLFVAARDVRLSTEGALRADILALDRKGRVVLVIVQRRSDTSPLVRTIACAGAVDSWRSEDFVRIMPAERAAALSDFLTVGLDQINSDQRAVLIAEHHDEETLLAVGFLEERMGFEISCFQASILRGLQGGLEYLSLARTGPPGEMHAGYPASPGSPAVDTVNLSQLVRGLYPLLGCLLAGEVAFEHELEADIPNVAAEITALQQALMQMTANASEALQGPGTIRVTTGHLRATHDYLLECSVGKELPSGRYAFVEVSDNGQGVDGEAERRMFEPFFSTRFAARGLGLTMVSDIVRRNGGAIRVDGKTDNRTTVRILFPSSELDVPSVGMEKLSAMPLVTDRIRRELTKHPTEPLNIWAVDEAQAELIKEHLTPAQVQNLSMLWPLDG